MFRLEYKVTPDSVSKLIRKLFAGSGRLFGGVTNGWLFAPFRSGDVLENQGGTTCVSVVECDGSERKRHDGCLEKGSQAYMQLLITGVH